MWKRSGQWGHLFCPRLFTKALCMVPATNLGRILHYEKWTEGEDKHCVDICGQCIFDLWHWARMTGLCTLIIGQTRCRPWSGEKREKRVPVCSAFLSAYKISCCQLFNTQQFANTGLIGHHLRDTRIFKWPRLQCDLYSLDSVIAHALHQRGKNISPAAAKAGALVAAFETSSAISRTRRRRKSCLVIFYFACLLYECFWLFLLVATPLSAGRSSPSSSSSTCSPSTGAGAAFFITFIALDFPGFWCQGRW